MIYVGKVKIKDFQKNIYEKLMKNISEIQNEDFNNLIKESTQTLKDHIIEAAKKANESNEPIENFIDEGVLTGIVGGVLGTLAGKDIMKAVCKALGINESGTLGSLMTSRIVLGMVGTYLGYKW